MEHFKLRAVFERGYVRLFSISVAVSLVAAMISWIICSYFVQPMYKSSVSLIIYNSESDRLTNYSDVMMSQQLVKTYCEYAKSIAVAEDVLQSLNLKMSVSQLHSMVSVAPKANTQFLVISVKSSDPEEAVRIANQLSLSLKKVSTEIMKYDLVKILDKAQYPSSPDGLSTPQTVILTFFISLTAILAVVCFFKYMSDPLPPSENS
ncbi:MAG: hypothetical protein N2484_02645 [Clostridia bacterium]|nr:hypothetical protein [Clostridia bacterium]